MTRPSAPPAGSCHPGHAAGAGGAYGTRSAGPSALGGRWRRASSAAVDDDSFARNAPSSLIVLMRGAGRRPWCSCPPRARRGV